MAEFVPKSMVPDNGEETIRPQRLEDFIGQEELRANMRVYLNAAK
ncbi:MAG: Holliday junction branch migration DNA helicase RuvB, partial [Mailhella sp.]|nr:Holliday junction branch migration DNA helicase RuvB [Mailhella sp.]